MIVDPSTLTREQVNGLIVGLIAPRPIAWVSTIAADGSRNLAPFSFFNAFSFSPPVVAIGPGARRGVEKDSLQNIRSTREFTISLVTEDLAERANRSGGDFPSAVDEWNLAGVTPGPTADVRPARVAESPASFECRVKQIVDLGSELERSNALVIGLVTRIWVDDEVLEGFVPQPDRLRLVARMGEDAWCKTTDRFDLVRPRGVELDELVSRLPS